MRFRRALLVGAMLLLGGCRIVGDVSIDVKEDGSGTVVAKVGLDQEALQRIGGLKKVRLDDLEGKGWKISELPSAAGADGLWWLSASTAFESPDQLGAVLAQIGGDPLLFADTKVEISDGFASTSYDAQVTVKSTGSIAQFSDAALIAALDGNPLGRTQEELAAQGGTDPKLATLRVSLKTPEGTRVMREVALNDNKGSSTQISATSSVTDAMARQLIILGAALIAAATLLTVFAGDSIRRLRRLKRPNRE